MTKKTPIQLKLDQNKAEGNLRPLGGGKADEWNNRLSNLTANALPIAYSKNMQSVTEAFLAVSYGVIDMAPADPVEGILIAQLIAANEAALAMYQKAWGQAPEYFAARTKYLQLADKAARTVIMLTERLDHHRGRGQQQITVKHVTVMPIRRSLRKTSPPRHRRSRAMRRSRSSRYSSRSWCRPGGGRNRNDRQPHAPMQCRSQVSG